MLRQSKLLDITLQYLLVCSLTYCLPDWISRRTNSLIGIAIATHCVPNGTRMHAKMQFRLFDCCKWPNVKKGTGKKSQQTLNNNHSKYPQCIQFCFLFPSSFALFRLRFWFLTCFHRFRISSGKGKSIEIDPNCSKNWSKLCQKFILFSYVKKSVFRMQFRFVFLHW